MPTTAGTIAPSASNTTRRVWLARHRRRRARFGPGFMGGGLETEALQAPVHCASRKAEGVRHLAHVALVAREGLLDEQQLHLVQAHLVQALGGASFRPQREVGGA